MSENSLTTVNESKNVDLQSVTISIPSSNKIDELAKDGLNKLVENYLDDGIIDNNELVDLVKCTMEIVEKNKEISGEEKKKISLCILRKFIGDKVKDYDNLEKLFDKAIDLCIKTAKDGMGKIKLSSEMIGDTKSAFNLIYSSTMSKIDEKYPLADDIINNIFDISLYILQLIEGQTLLGENEKKVLLKKIITKVINSLDSKISKDQQLFLVSQIDPTISLVQIALRAEKGEFKINVVKAVGCFKKCFSRS